MAATASADPRNEMDDILAKRIMGRLQAINKLLTTAEPKSVDAVEEFERDVSRIKTLEMGTPKENVDPITNRNTMEINPALEDAIFAQLRRRPDVFNKSAKAVKGKNILKSFGSMDTTSMSLQLSLGEAPSMVSLLERIIETRRKLVAAGMFRPLPEIDLNKLHQTQMSDARKIETCTKEIEDILASCKAEVEFEAQRGDQAAELPLDAELNEKIAQLAEVLSEVINIRESEEYPPVSAGDYSLVGELLQEIIETSAETAKSSQQE